MLETLTATTSTHARRAALALSLVLALAGCSALADLPAGAGDLERSEAPAQQAEPVPEWAPSIPLEDGADWVELRSGEWLRGALQRLKQSTLEFDSSELDDLEVDREDVRRLRSGGDVVVLTEDGRVLRGRLVVDEESAWVVGTTTTQLRRAELLSVLALEDGGDRTWSGEVSLGASTRSGNTRQTDYVARVELLRESARSSWKSTYAGTVVNTEDVETANNHRATTALEQFLSRRYFVTLPGIEAYRDRFQNIDLRLTAYAALGYRILDGVEHEWSVGLGPAVRYTRLESPGAGQGAEDTTAAVALTSEYAWDVTGDVELSVDYALTVPLPDSREYNHNLALRVEVELTGNLDLDVGLVWERVNAPGADASGDVPRRDDLRTTVGLGWSF